jgi:hypothetical protein
VSDRIVLKWPLTFTGHGIGLTQFMQPGPVVAVAWQHENVTVWIDHPVESQKIQRSFEAIPTGLPFPPGATHVGSAISDDLVFHVYEVSGP